MDERTEQATEVLRALWSPDAATEAALDLDPEAGAALGGKVCKRMRGITFDGMAEPGSDLREAWRDLLRREGKYDGSGETIRDLVLGRDEQTR